MGAHADCLCLHVVQGTRDYSVGEGPDVSVQAAAQTMGLELRQDFKAQQVDFERDIVKFDVVFVMDKYTAADILREVRLQIWTLCRQHCLVIVAARLDSAFLQLRL